jgi:IS5 family transposase
MELEDHIIAIYVRIEEIYQEITKERPLRRRGFAPGLSDVEVLTMEIIGEMEGRNGDRAIWRYFDAHWRDWFPKLSAYKTFAKHCANLAWIKEPLMQRLFQSADDPFQIIDGVPLPLAHNARAYRAKMLKEYGAWGFCAAKDEHYYGLKGHLVINGSGQITALALTPANVDERAALWDFVEQIKGMLIGDKGYIGKDLQADLTAHGIDLQTPLRDNMHDPRPRSERLALNRLRKPVETTLSVLIDHFHLTKIKAHDLWHYTNKLLRKLIAYNFYLTLKC